MSESTTASEAIEAALRSEPVRDAVTDVFEDMHLAFLRAGDRGPEMLRECLWAALDAAGAAVFHAVRLMSPEQLAELIGGAVETAWIRTFTKDGSGGPIDAQDAEDAAEYAARASLWGAGPVTTHFAGRVVGPWLPVIPVTHQGEETT